MECGIYNHGREDNRGGQNTQMDAANDKWWAEVLPRHENETAVQGAVNPYHELYWKQFRGPGPNHVPPGTKPAMR